MRTLVIDSATDACSVALFDDRKLVAGVFEVLGRGHAERLVPMIAQLPEHGRADRIAVSLGPGSFTGVRVGLAAARALALAWQAGLAGYPTLAFIAAMARERHGAVPVAVVTTGGHGEWFMQRFAADGTPLGPVASLRRCRYCRLHRGLRRWQPVGSVGNGARPWQGPAPAARRALLRAPADRLPYG